MTWWWQKLYIQIWPKACFWLLRTGYVYSSEWKITGALMFWGTRTFPCELSYHASMLLHHANKKQPYQQTDKRFSFRVCHCVDFARIFGQKHAQHNNIHFNIHICNKSCTRKKIPVSSHFSFLWPPKGLHPLSPHLEELFCRPKGVEDSSPNFFVRFVLVFPVQPPLPLLPNQEPFLIANQ